MFLSLEPETISVIHNHGMIQFAVAKLPRKFYPARRFPDPESSINPFKGMRRHVRFCVMKETHLSQQVMLRCSSFQTIQHRKLECRQNSFNKHRAWLRILAASKTALIPLDTVFDESPSYGLA